MQTQFLTQKKQLEDTLAPLIPLALVIFPALVILPALVKATGKPRDLLILGTKTKTKASPLGLMQTLLMK